jgi:hypothetical protein
LIDLVRTIVKLKLTSYCKFDVLYSVITVPYTVQCEQIFYVGKLKSDGYKLSL